MTETDEFDSIACDAVARFFTIFAQPTRMRVFCALSGGARTVAEVAAHAGITPSNASQHLSVMRDRGAVVARKVGQRVYYDVADPRFLEAAQLIREALEQKASGSGLGRASVSSSSAPQVSNSSPQESKQ